MNSIEDICMAFEALELNLLDDLWVDNLWSNKFMDCSNNLPDEYIQQAIKSPENLSYCKDVIKMMLKCKTNVANWAALQDVPYKKILSLIFCYTKNAFVFELDIEDCFQLGIKSAELYFTLLSIPGSNVYNIFQKPIFQSCLNMISILINEIENMRFHTNHENNNGWVDLMADPKNMLTLINELLIEFHSFVQSFSFKNQSESLNLSLTVMAEVTRCERSVSLNDFIRCNDKSTYAFLSKNAYLILNEFCSEFHGRDTMRLVLFHLLPNLLLIGGKTYPFIKLWSTREHTVMRSLAIWFVKSFIIEKGEESHQCILILLQHLCYNMYERADYRAKATDLIISLLSSLPKKPYFAFLKWIFMDAFHETSSQRVIALELLSKLLFVKEGKVEMSNMSDSGHSTQSQSHSQLDPSHTHSNSIELTNPASRSSSETHTDTAGESDFSARIVSFCKPIEYVPFEYRHMMLAIILNRFQDSTPSVYVKAFSALSEIISNQSSPTIQKLVRTIFVDPYLSEGEIKYTDDENPFLSCDEFQDELEKPNLAHVPFPGGTKIFERVIKRCVNEKVVARRAALHLLFNIFKFNIQWMTKSNLQLFGRNCRDPSLMIRKEMLNLVTELMLFYPNHAPLTKMWVQEVVPQIADRESKVQESARNVLTRTILVNIKPLSRTVTTIHLLPWKLLTQIAALKNRIFLTNACYIWKASKTPELDGSKIESVISHIGSEQDAPCWVMLASLSEYIDITKPQPIMDHYVNVVAKGESELSVANLVLLTLNNCCHMLTKENKILLENELLESLRNQKTTPYTVPLIVKIRANLRHQLSKSKEVAQKELSKWSLETVEDCDKIIDSYLNNESEEYWDSCLYHVILLGCLSDLLEEHVSKSTVQRILIFLKHIKPTEDATLVKLQAASIITLGRIALKIHDIAGDLVNCLNVLLSHSKNETLLNNVVVTIADIGERCPNLIDPFISSLSICLKHRNREVRKTCLDITIELLQEDYLKARGALIFNLMTLIHDPIRHTNSTVKSYLTNCFFPKLQCPQTILLQAIYHYNKYDHSSYKRIEVSPGEEASYNLSGAKMHGKRLAIYRFLMSSVKIQATWHCYVAIAETIFSKINQDHIDVNSTPGEQILLDLLGLLSTKNIKCCELSKKKGVEEEEEGNDELQKAELAGHAQAQNESLNFSLTIMRHCLKIRKQIFKHLILYPRFYFFVREWMRDVKPDHFNDHFIGSGTLGMEIQYELTNRAKEDWSEDIEIDNKCYSSSNKRKSDEHLPENEIRKKIRESLESVEKITNNLESCEKNDNVAKSPQPLHVDGSPQEVNAPANIHESSSALSNREDLSKIKQVSVLLEKLPDDFKVPSERNTRRSSVKAITQKKSTSKPEPVKIGRKRTVVPASSDNLDNSDNLEIILPPSQPSRSSGKNASTPTVPSRIGKAPLFSSTPLVSKPNGFDSSDISPVVRNSSCNDT